MVESDKGSFVQPDEVNEVRLRNILNAQIYSFNEKTV